MRIVNTFFSFFAIIAFGLVSPAMAEGGPILENTGLAAIGIAIASFGGALGQGNAIASALDSIGRNPGAAGEISKSLILSLAFIESLVIFSLLIALKAAGFI